MIRHFPVGFLLALRLVLSAVCFAGAAAPAWAQFETRTVTPLPAEVFGVVAGDFNHDGKQDIAVAGGYLSVLLGNGDGTFQPPVNYTGLAGWIAEGDFNDDGNLDLATCNEAASVSVYMGNADGTFQSPEIIPTTEDCRFVAVGDFNGDHKLDIAVIDYNFLSVLPGNGDGTFQPPIDNNSLVGQQSFAVGDFNNDGRLDVAVAGAFGGGANIAVLLGNGNGTLQPPLTYPLKSTPVLIAAADFNRDGNLDVVVGLEFGGVDVFLGQGDGGFFPGVLYSTYGGTGEVYVSDFNGDGIPDLAVATAAGFSELLGKGDGSFGPPVHFTAGQYAYALGIGDFNGDHEPDVLYLDAILGATTLLNTGALTFSPTTPLAFPVQLVNKPSTPIVLKLTNSGSKEVSIHSVAASEQFHAADDCGGTIAAGASCNLNVVFEPAAAGIKSGLVKLYDGASSKPQVIEVSGRGTFVALSPNPLKFADQKVGTQSPPQRLAITNDGSTSLTIQRVWIDGVDRGDFLLSDAAHCIEQPLAAGATCEVAVTFAPKQTGRRAGTILVHDSGVGSPEIATLSGRGSSQ